ncbi:deoxyguanosinetriphosphate triphosphohydrolase [Sphingomonas sp.]|uniref:deoxyguanosinetriphosphate triphosphohydrolase n=1 Tax=Sphingomonas sp. TaxID=28214 RepID=UPI003AFFB821
MTTALAADPARSRGRRHPEPEGATRGPRDAFQRDRDRIVHAIAFRRLRHKTQVFVAPDGDHFRVRLTHSLEVAQIGRTIARALGLNEDLTEALCLAHDIGHPPFGHAGEDALRQVTALAGGFDHNGHTLRVLTRLDSPYPRFPGLNLTWETLEGLAKHNGPIARPDWALAEADADFPLALAEWPGLEAQVAAVADDIAYDNHDIDDGLRAGLLDLGALLTVPLVARTWAGVRARFPDVTEHRLHRELVRDLIGVMVSDVIAATRARIADAGVRDGDEARRLGHALSGFSDELAGEERVLKQFMYANLYHSPRQLAVAAAVHGLVRRLFAAYAADPTLLPPAWREALPAADPYRTRHIADFVAGMTDRYAISRHRELVGPVDLPDGF